MHMPDQAPAWLTWHFVEQVGAQNRGILLVRHPSCLLLLYGFLCSFHIQRSCKRLAIFLGFDLPTYVYLVADECGVDVSLLPCG